MSWWSNHFQFHFTFDIVVELNMQWTINSIFVFIVGKKDNKINHSLS